MTISYQDYKAAKELIKQFDKLREAIKEQRRLQRDGDFQDYITYWHNQSQKNKEEYTKLYLSIKKKTFQDALIFKPILDCKLNEILDNTKRLRKFGYFLQRPDLP